MEYISKMQIKRSRFICILFLTVTLFSTAATASLIDDLTHLKAAYPDFISSVDEKNIVWKDGTSMSVQDSKANKTEQEKLDSPSLKDQLEQSYFTGKPANANSFVPASDPGRIRYEPFFKKMYGDSSAKVNSKLTTVYWMPATFGHQYPLKVTTVNSVDKQLALVSSDLDKLVADHPEYKRYLESPAGLFLWRNIANTNRLSPHSYGIAFDLNIKYTNYWQWELQKRKLPISEATQVPYVNHIPWPIVLIFEKHGFIWGGKWRHFDTMHFEYRPELLIK